MEKALKSSEFRFERKFVITGLQNREIISLIKMHPSFFSEIFYQRNVNNIYFDTHHFKYYWDNVDGTADRIKVRIRWYGDLFGKIEKPVLEYKIKSALVGRKESYKLQPFQLNPGFTMDEILEVILSSELPDKVKEDFKKLQPRLLNRYTRRYFMSSNKNFRITVDKDLEYYRINTNNNYFLQKFRDSDTTIVELKYGTELDNTANSVSTLFPFRMTKSSKYVNGVDKFFGSTI